MRAFVQGFGVSCPLLLQLLLLLLLLLYNKLT